MEDMTALMEHQILIDNCRTYLSQWHDMSITTQAVEIHHIASNGVKLQYKTLTPKWQSIITILETMSDTNIIQTILAIYNVLKELEAQMRTIQSTLISSSQI